MSRLAFDSDIMKVTAESLPYVLNNCFIYKISHDLQTNIKALSHQNIANLSQFLAPVTLTLTLRRQFKVSRCIV